MKNNTTNENDYGTLCRTFKPGDSVLIGDVLIIVDKVVGEKGGARLIIRAKKSVKIERL